MTSLLWPLACMAVSFTCLVMLITNARYERKLRAQLYESFEREALKRNTLTTKNEEPRS